MLDIVDPNQPFVVQMNASEFAIYVVISQKEKNLSPMKENNLILLIKIILHVKESFMLLFMLWKNGGITCMEPSLRMSLITKLSNGWEPKQNWKVKNATRQRPYKSSVFD